MRRALLSVLLAAAAGLSPGCRAVGNYFLGRAGDLSDAFQVALGAPAAGFHAEAGVIFNTGLDGWRSFGKYGGEIGNFSGRLPRPGNYAGYSVVFFHARGTDTDPRARDPADDAAFPPSHAGFPTHLHELGRAFDGLPVPENLRPLRWLDAEVGAAMIVGLRVRVSPGELLDFLLGWFGIDLAGDDPGSNE